MNLFLPRSGGGQTVEPDVDPTVVISGERRAHTSGAPWVYANMVSSVDGGAVIDGRSGGLGGPGDRVVFRALRACADVVLVGAETVRAERYHLPTAPTRLCIVTRSGRLPDDLPLFEELAHEYDPSRANARRPLLATTATTDVDDERFDVLRVGDESVDLAALVTELGRRGIRRVLCEGGPSLLAQLGDAGLVDEWDFTVAPVVLGGDAARPVHSAEPFRRPLTLDRLLLDDDGSMYTRYLDRPVQPANSTSSAGTTSS